MINETGLLVKTREELLDEIAQLKEEVVELKAKKNRERTLDTADFKMRLEDEIARSTRYKYEFSLLLMEMDNLDKYKAKCDEDSADELSAMLKTTMPDIFRKTDIYCQLSAGKYGIVLPHTGIDGALVAAEKLRQKIERVFALLSQSSKIQLTASIGAVSYPKDAIIYGKLLLVARNALDSAKAEGGNRIWSSAADKNNNLSKSIGGKYTKNALLSKAIDEEINRYSRCDQEFSLMIVSPSGTAIEKAKKDIELRTTIMQNIYKLINLTIRNTDQCYFHTGNQFALILTNTDLQNARIVAQKLIQNIQDLPIISYQDGTMALSARIGIGCFPVDEISGEALLLKTETTLNHGINDFNAQIISVSEKSAIATSEKWNLSELIASLKEAGRNGLFNLISVVDQVENSNEPHSQTVAKFALAIGQAMKLPLVEKNKLRLCALLHDVGKILIPENILKKSEPLSPEEWMILQKHTIYGESILKQLPDFASYSIAVKAHHERWDGTGYPEGLAGKRIPFEAQVLAVAEAYVDMVTSRPNRPAIHPIYAIEDIIKSSGTQFNPDIVKIFTDVVHHTN